MPGRAEDQRTRTRLIEAATRQFAARGFKQVTVRTICREARANVAAVNYHFRDKLGLYTEVLESAVAVMEEATGAAIREGHGLSAEEKLRAYIRVVTRRVFAHGADSWLHQLINREVADPTPVVSTLIDRGVRPRIEYLGRVVGELLGRSADDPQVLMCVSSIHAQIIMFRPNRIADALRQRLNLPKLTPDVVADHIASFSMAGLSVFLCAPPQRTRRRPGAARRRAAAR